MTIQGMRAVAIYDPATGATVQIDKLVANSFDFSKGRYDTGERGPAGGRLNQADASACSFSFIDSDGSKAGLLELWMSERRRVSLVGAGISTCVQWYEDDHFNVQRAPLRGAARGRSDVYEFEITRTGHGRHAIYQQTNLLAHLAGLGGNAWQEGASDLAKGYTDLGLGTLDWSDLNSSQGVTHNAADAGIYADIVFPLRISGFSLTFSSETVDSHSDTATAKIRMQGRDFGGFSVANPIDESGSGRKSVVIDTAPGISLYIVRVFPILTPSGISSSDRVAAKEPALRIDGKTEYISA